MIFNLMMLLSTFMMITITLSSTPINTGLWIIITTLTLSLTMAIMMSSWFSLILFLIYIGGLLVMFAYFVAIQPNQKMKMKKMLATLLISFTLFSPSISSFPSPLSPQQMSLTYILEILLPSNIQVLTFLGLTLFLALVAVVKMTNMYLGPLRPFNK